MTAALQSATRRAGPVQSLAIAHATDLRAAEEWLREHHVPVVRCHPVLMSSDALKFWPRPGQSHTATVGQRLVYDVRGDLFTVMDSADYEAAHEETA